MMRVLLGPGTWAGGQCGRLDESEQQHLRVRRVVEGEAVELRDGAGLVGTGRLVLERREWVVEIEAVDVLPPPAELVLAVGAGDRERFAWMVEKAAELGVTAVVPLETARTVGVASKLREGQLERVRRRALEAVKQCGAAWAPVVSAPVSVAEFVLALGGLGDGAAAPERTHRLRTSTQSSGGASAPALLPSRWLADARGAPPPAVLGVGAPVSVVVGPEGGLTDEERAMLCEAGFVPTTLGPHTLRFETAALAAAAAVATARQRGTHG